VDHGIFTPFVNLMIAWLVAETALEFISRPRELGCKFLQSSLGKEVRALLRQTLAIARLLMKNLRVHRGASSSTYFKA
jgi:hypothetical protein